MGSHRLISVFIGLLFICGCLAQGVEKQGVRISPSEEVDILPDFYLQTRHLFDSLHLFQAGIMANALTDATRVRHLLPVFPLLRQNPAGLPLYTQSLGSQLLKSANRYTELYHHLCGISGHAAGGYGPPVSGIQPFVLAFDIRDFQADPHYLPESEDLHIEARQEDLRQWALLPPEIRKLFAELLHLQKEKNRTDRLVYPGKDHHSCSLEELLEVWQSRELENQNRLKLLEEINLQLAAFYNRRYLRGLQTIRSQIPDQISVPEEFSFCRFQSDIGTLVLSGGGQDTIRGRPALVMDLGGNDVYYPANTVNAYRSALFLDLAGDDVYGSATTAYSVCTAHMGSFVLIDLKGNDQYFSEKGGPCFALGGLALLHDKAGDDSYITREAYGQASAIFGSAILLDDNGQDEYYCRMYGQGFGGTEGVALLLDLQGDDLYRGGSEVIASGSFVQGSAKGRWGQASDGLNLAGGAGILIDGRGTDIYQSNTFSQGAAYYQGFGFLFDQLGDDHYLAESHSQASASHFGIGSLLDASGNDTFNLEGSKDKISQILGYARDFSLASLVNMGGDDKYAMGNKCGGVGDVYGCAFFWDTKGADTYAWYNNEIYKNFSSLGDAQVAGPGLLLNHHSLVPFDTECFGSHMDGGGKDRYLYYPSLNTLAETMNWDQRIQILEKTSRKVSFQYDHR